LNRIGVIMASGIGGMQTMEDELINFADNGRNPRFGPSL
jgi:3-oxoacyl-[acyl-carrier-protein] synthase II